MKRASKPMVWWIRFVLIGILWLSLGIPNASALPTVHLNPHNDADFDEQIAALTVKPELTSSAETPIAEAEAQQVSARDWFDEVVATAEAAEPEADSVDNLLNHWLTSVQSLFEGPRTGD